jgi:hypothetical protein
MPSIEYANKEAENLKEWLGSRKIEDIRFPTNVPAIDIQFQGQVYIRLNFPAPDYSFDGRVELRDRKNLINPATEITRKDREILLMAFNILEKDEAGGFIRACGEHVEELWTD